MTNSSNVNVACVGVGYWGKNLVRNFNQIPECLLTTCCDIDTQNLQTVAEHYPSVCVTESYEEVLSDSNVDAVVLASPVVEHYSMTKQALEAGKHVYVEKPLTMDVQQATALCELSDATDRVLMVGHLMEYHPGLLSMKQLVDSGELGGVFYLYSQRVNLGIVKKEENALWSLAPHDVSIVLHILGQMPQTVSARGASYLQPEIEDVVFLNLKFADNVMAHIQVSWLDPHKVRKLTVVGSKKMAVFDDEESREKLRIYDKGVDVLDYDSYGDSLTLRSGDIAIPWLDMTEPLRAECQHFVACVQQGQTPRSDGRDGLRVVQVLEAANRSMAANGAPITISA